MFEPKPCPECGPDSVNHQIEYLSTLLDFVLGWVFAPLGFLARVSAPIIRILPSQLMLSVLVEILPLLRIATVTYKLDTDDNLRTKALWESAEKRGIKMKEFRIFGRPPANFFAATFNGKRIVFDDLPRPKALSSPSLFWMDDKGKIKRRFIGAGLPVARGGECQTAKQARELFHTLRAPVIAKPRFGSRSRHTTVHIFTESELERAFLSAHKLSPWVMVEEELTGTVYRGTVVNGKTVGVISREFPYVAGDGASTIRQLVSEENKNPMRRGPVFHEIPVDDPEVTAELKRQHLDWESVPAKGERVQMHPKMSRSFGATSRDVTSETHPDNVRLFEHVGEILQDPIVGIDFITSDITKSWKVQDHTGIIECNSMPFVDLHHYPYIGTPRDVAGTIWDLVFPVKDGQLLPNEVPQQL